MQIKKPGARIIKTGLALFLSMILSSLRASGLPFYSG
ncbi:MAG: FUSC family protein, partial [Peptoniphilaceae bacterium]|nr:FUSC family protein [Peptoniphilaceae bacterium]